jgi:arylsulfatase A-like enzyme
VPASILQQRWPWLAAAALVVLVYAASLSIRIGGGDPRATGTADDIVRLASRDDVNVLFILIDTLRSDRLGSYGYERDTSPALDLLAASGVRFAHQLAQSSWTKCSMASLWTGLNPARSGVTRFDQVLPSEAQLPAEILREARFRTVGVYRNGWVAPNFGFAQGFEVYDRPRGRPLPPSVRRENPTLSEEGTDDDAVDAAIEFLRVNGRERWFLYLHLMDVHEYLYDQDSAVFGTSYSDIYDNSILHTNLVLDRLLAYLAENGHLERTLVAVTSDHGEAFGERGFEGHAREVYRETTEVPWILAFPFRLDPGVVIDARTSNVDIWPTLLELLGLPPMPKAEGRSRVPEILAAARGEPPPPPTSPAIAHLDRFWGRPVEVASPIVAIAEDGLRYVTLREPSSRTASEELFDAKSDPGELRNVATERAEETERMRGIAQQYLASEPVWGEPSPTLELDEIQLNQLRALGYALP